MKKITLSVVIAILLQAFPQILATVNLSQDWKTVIQILIILIPISLERFETEKQKRIEQAKTARLRVEVSLGFLQGFKELFSAIATDWKISNWKKSENIPSHLFIGAICFVLFTFANTPHWIVFLVAGSLFTILVGWAIEELQAKYCEGVQNLTDVRFGWYGFLIFGLLWLLVAPLFQTILLKGILIVIFSATAYFCHSMHSKKKINEKKE